MVHKHQNMIQITTHFTLKTVVKAVQQHVSVHSTPLLQLAAGLLAPLCSYNVLAYLVKIVLPGGRKDTNARRWTCSSYIPLSSRNKVQSRWQQSTEQVQRCQTHKHFNQIPSKVWFFLAYCGTTCATSSVLEWQSIYACYRLEKGWCEWLTVVDFFWNTKFIQKQTHTLTECTESASKSWLQIQVLTHHQMSLMNLL
jgi:hypothetical protein